MSIQWFEALLIAVTSVGSAAIALIVASLVTQRMQARRPARSTLPELEPAVFLFDDHQLVDATGPARALLETAPAGATDWARLTAVLAPRFEGFCERMQSLGRIGRIEMTSRSDAGDLRLCAEEVEGLARITLFDRDAEGSGALVDGLSLRALEDELDLTRRVLDDLPALAWREDAGGAVTWANRSYVLRAEALDKDGIGITWPLPQLFPDLEAEATGQRISLAGAQDKALWFEGYSHPLGEGRIRYAMPADALVRAERSLRDFIQTLSKTFADLPIGLAVFDRRRQLQLFNPALAELTMLPPDFLLGRPTLHAFLDRLRETRMVPEPRDYTGWRQHMADLEKAAASGFHSETWTLPRGQTYRVTGRPHPDGAVAFLFEDITSEVAVMRRFRAELELGQAVLDRLDEAIAIFGSTDELVMSNAAYDRLWRTDAESGLGRTTFAAALLGWRQLSGPDSFWQQVQDRRARTAPRTETAGVLCLAGGQHLACCLTPLPGGATMARFTPLPATASETEVAPPAGDLSAEVASLPDPPVPPPIEVARAAR